MKKFRIKPEYLDLWMGSECSPDPDYVVTEDELVDLSRQWEKPMPELLEELEEI